MRLVAISDTHGLHQHVQIPDGDVLIHAGDFMNSGRTVAEARRFFEWFVAHPHPHKIVIAGNHDILFETQPLLAATQVPDTISYLEDSAIEIGGIKFWGSPVTPRFLNWAFNRDRGEDIDRHWQRVPQDTDVLITHGPPYGILDTIRPGSKPLGCQDLRRRVSEVLPRLHIFGHVHGGYGVTDLHGGPTVFANVAVCTETYQPTRPATVIDL